MKAKKMAIIPSDMEAKTLPNGEVVLQKRRRTRRRRRLSAETRRRMAASANKMKLPLLALSSVGIPVADALSKAMVPGQVSAIDRVATFGNAMVENYTGFSPVRGDFKLSRATKGLGPLLVTFALAKTGVTKYVNQALGKAKIPLLRL